LGIQIRIAESKQKLLYQNTLDYIIIQNNTAFFCNKRNLCWFMYLLRGVGRAAEPEEGLGEIDGKVNILRQQMLFSAQNILNYRLK